MNLEESLLGAPDPTRPRLEPSRLIEAAERLDQAVRERLPNTHLAKLSGEILTIARETARRVKEAQRPIFRIRILSALALGTAVVGIVFIARHVQYRAEVENVSEVLEGIDAGFNILILLGGMLLYLTTLESRIKKRRVMENLHELKELLHLVDMNQLAHPPQLFANTSTDPTQAVGRDSFYLIAHIRMFSLIGNLAAAYSQNVKDDSVLRMAGHIETMASGYTEKLWEMSNLLLQLASQAGRQAEAEAPGPQTGSRSWRRRRAGTGS